MSRVPCHRAVRVVLLLTMSAAPALVSAQQSATPAPFLALEWGTPIDSALARATRAGWEFLRVDEDSDFVFHARLDGRRTTAYLSFGPRGLVRMEVGVQPHETTPETYRALVDTLSRYFGAPALATGDDSPVRPAARMVAASAWPGVLLGLRRDGWISLILMCPESAPALPFVGRIGLLRKTAA